MSPSKYFYTGSPFMPTYDRNAIVREVMKDIKEGTLPPTAAIAFSLQMLMKDHITAKVFPQENRLRRDFGTSPIDILRLSLGYQFPLDALILTIGYVVSGSKIEAATHCLNNSADIPLVKIYNDHLLGILDITTNLMDKDITGLLILRYLNERPFLSDDYFASGHEFANHAYLDIAAEVAKRL